ncbi:AraC family transcriptional regulator [Manganibacter manganicus]|uniref:AraC family transcriptional regulator n=1 Tax=Manganibacter manganicus TaxID=1873176 RepID=A0A1V8RUM5_9HYPH|nr:helix-turn-helix transcriptional regulator [Pseudaminobacter manganicus]OQM76865.1 AraC family transcriptional regulator [Pseudaminobacter manganicus]
MKNALGPRLTDSELFRLHEGRWRWVEEADQPVVTLPTEYPDSYRVPRHHHSRSQLLHALTGVVLVTTINGRWMVPPDHAMWIPAGTDHSVEMLGDVAMRSVYVVPDALSGLPESLRVVGVTPLMRSLIIESEKLPQGVELEGRAALIMQLLLHEVPHLPERPLALPLPTDPRLAALCRNFVAAPSPHATIDEWARQAGLSRRSFTRLFHRQTGLTLSTWRQQACLFAALPRLAEGEPITRVALDLGYDSVPAFTTMFKRMLGAAPRAYMNATR